MQTHFTVTAVVMHSDKVLILQKSKDDCNYPDKWGFCSGFVKEFEAAEDAVMREIKEETGLNAEIVKTGGIFEIEDREKAKCWIVKCFLCRSGSDSVRLCRENQNFKWVAPEDIGKYDCVPGLKKDLKVLSLI